MKTRTQILAVVVIVAVVVIALAAAWWSSRRGEPGAGAITPVPAAQLNADAYPLYGGVSWSAPVAATEGALSGYEVSALAAEDTNDIASTTTPFDQYYQQKLTTAGWSVVNALAAGGPGASVTGYQKGSDYLLVMFSTKFKGGGPNEPVQCPCDVTLSVFSGASP